MASYGSHPRADNIRKDYDHDNTLAEKSPKETDHPFAVAPGTELRQPLEAEMLRRDAAKRRDIRKRWRNTPNSPVLPDAEV